MGMRNAIGLLVALGIASVLVLWAITSESPRDALQVVGIFLAVLMAVALVVLLVIDSKYLAGARRSTPLITMAVVLVAVGTWLAISGLTAVGLAALLASAAIGALWIRSRPLPR